MNPIHPKRSILHNCQLISTLVPIESTFWNSKWSCPRPCPRLQKNWCPRPCPRSRFFRCPCPWTGADTGVRGHGCPCPPISELTEKIEVRKHAANVLVAQMMSHCSNFNQPIRHRDKNLSRIISEAIGFFVVVWEFLMAGFNFDNGGRRCIRPILEKYQQG